MDATEPVPMNPDAPLVVDPVPEVVAAPDDDPVVAAPDDDPVVAALDDDPFGTLAAEDSFVLAADPETDAAVDQLVAEVVAEALCDDAVADNADADAVVDDAGAGGGVADLEAGAGGADLEAGCGDDQPLVVLGVDDLKQLHAQAVSMAGNAVAAADEAHQQELRDLGARLRAEQETMYTQIMTSIPAAVQGAAAAGQRTATLMRFSGSDRLGEFCYLYMLKGPHRPDLRNEMRAMGAKPLLYRLRAELQAAGFAVHHSWQRATNDNSLSLSW